MDAGNQANSPSAADAQLALVTETVVTIHGPAHNDELEGVVRKTKSIGRASIDSGNTPRTPCVEFRQNCNRFSTPRIHI